MSEHEKDEIEGITRSQRKKEVTELQKIGEALVGLPDSLLMKIPLPEHLLDSIQHARSMKSHEAKRRQLQYIGKVMREVDVEPIQKALKKIQLRNEKETNEFHQVEQWREELIHKGDDALQKLMELHPHADRQNLRQLIRQAQKDRLNNKKTGGELNLFKYLRTLLGE